MRYMKTENRNGVERCCVLCVQQVYEYRVTEAIKRTLSPPTVPFNYVVHHI